MSSLRTILAALVMSATLLVSPGLAASPVERYPTLAREISRQIRAQQMRCETMRSIDVYAQTARGDVFDVICEHPSRAYRYRVLIAPDGAIVARPWSEVGPRGGKLEWVAVFLVRSQLPSPRSYHASEQ